MMQCLATFSLTAAEVAAASLTAAAAAVAYIAAVATAAVNSSIKYSSSKGCLFCNKYQSKQNFRYTKRTLFI